MKFTKLPIIFIFLMAFAVSVSAQENRYPNELAGYNFFGSGKFKELKPTIYSREDVGKIFGNDCIEKCDYDDDWSIRFEYFEHIWEKTDHNEKDEILKYLPDSKYLGKLRLIEVYPKKQISFRDVVFPNSFKDLLIASCITTRDPRKLISTAKYAFKDSYGLTYETKIGSDYDNEENSKIPPFSQGDLISIRYELSEELTNTLYILQK